MHKDKSSFNLISPNTQKQFIALIFYALALYIENNRYNP